jgi:hypothetical protein
MPEQTSDLSVWNVAQQVSWKCLVLLPSPNENKISNSFPMNAGKNKSNTKGGQMYYFLSVCNPRASIVQQCSKDRLGVAWLSNGRAQRR